MLLRWDFPGVHKLQVTTMGCTCIHQEVEWTSGPDVQGEQDVVSPQQALMRGESSREKYGVGRRKHIGTPSTEEQNLEDTSIGNLQNCHWASQKSSFFLELDLNGSWKK